MARRKKQVFDRERPAPPIRARHLAGWQNKSIEFLAKANNMLEIMREYWPLTLRQLYYRLVGVQVIENEMEEYKRLSRALIKARLQGLIPWESIEDRVRSYIERTQYADADVYVALTKKHFLAHYARDLLQTQPVSLEVWTEKDAVVGLCERAANQYGVPIIVTRGNPSITFIHELKERVFYEAETNNRPTHIIYLNDFDPSGMKMLPAVEHTLKTEMGVPADIFTAERCMLTHQQFVELNLPYSIKAIKWKDRNAKAFVEQYGHCAAEMDALEPAAFIDILDKCIRSNLDLSEFDHQVELQDQDADQIAPIRQRALEAIDQQD
ncbi:hypothetical protein ACFL02_02050 [Planctomycetota bacterium]